MKLLLEYLSGWILDIILKKEITGLILGLGIVFKDFTFNLIAVPAYKSKDMYFAFKTHTEKKRLSLSSSYVYFGKNDHQLGIDFNFGGNYFTFYNENALKNFSDPTIINNSGEYVSSASIINNTKLQLNSVIGGSIIVLPRTTFSLEYNYNSNQNSKQTYNNFLDALPLSSSLYNPVGMGKHRFYGSLLYRDTYQRFNLSVSAFYDPINSQTTIFPTFELNQGYYKIEFTNFFYSKKAIRLFEYQSRLVLSIFF